MTAFLRHVHLHLIGACIAVLSTLAIATPPMERVVVEPDIELAYQVQGTGEPVVLIHAGLFADWFQPLIDEPLLRQRYRVVSFQRMGYGQSSHTTGDASVTRQAAQVAALMRHLGIERAHLVGHSSGGNIALQLALDAPQRVQSLALLEPALPVSEGADRLLSTRASAIAPILASYRAGDKFAAIDGFMRMVAGPAYRAPLEQALPGVVERALADVDTFFQQELPALAQWRFTREEGARIQQPALAVIGALSKDVSPIWPVRQQQVLAWLPHAEPFELAGTAHLLHVQEPRAMAQALTAFFWRHSMAAAR